MKETFSKKKCENNFYVLVGKDPVQCFSQPSVTSIFPQKIRNKLLFTFFLVITGRLRPRVQDDDDRGGAGIYHHCHNNNVNSDNNSDDDNQTFNPDDGGGIL